MTALSTRVKICGFTRKEDTFNAIAAGADALGFNFWPQSKRYITPEAARHIIKSLPPFIVSVGLFVNQQRDEIEGIARCTGINMLQLHGDESPADCEGYSLPVIKGLRVDKDFNPEVLKAYKDKIAAYLVDAPSMGFGGFGGFGGSGTSFDWNLLRGVSLSLPLILAGGLTPANIVKAINIVKPYAVDVASGVETAPGIKDSVAMQRFVALAKGSTVVL
ncbi:MAG: phosphoribosylanthranilate isomerase [Deltaproteobacteria bacterium]|nr:phosphoribosylanthranilate isomerase [Deltaproteobacteria bacterium]